MARLRQKRTFELEWRWRELLSDYSRSGLSIRAFCYRRRLNEANFYAWRRELVRRDAGRAKIAAPTFVPVQVTPSAAIEVVLSAGLMVRVPAGADGDLAVRLVTALRAASC